MNKNVFLFFSVLTLTILLVGACGSAPPPPEQPAPVVQPPPPEQPAPVVEPPPPKDPYNRHSSGIILDGAAQYTVQTGDTLTSISRQFYADGSYYPLIMIVSGDVVSDPDRIEPGMHLTIPVLKSNLDDARARESVNRSLLDSAAIEEQRGRRATAALMRNNAE
jgi:hypothetical protein